MDSPRTEQSITRYLPNDGPIGYAQMNWRSFIQNKTDVTLDNGMVTELHIVKPSEALGPLAGIGDLFKGIFAIPGALFASDTATINAKNAQLKAEQDNLQAKANLLTAELKYELLRKCLVDNPGHAEKCVAN